MTKPMMGLRALMGHPAIGDREEGCRNNLLRPEGERREHQRSEGREMMELFRPLWRRRHRRVLAKGRDRDDHHQDDREADTGRTACAEAIGRSIITAHASGSRLRGNRTRAATSWTPIVSTGLWGKWVFLAMLKPILHSGFQP